ncbi:MAG: ferrochelatase, partial [Acidimicrobiales bacterium]|nr:ferrochelatase [Acidimicrobiales bacterium]
MNEPTPSPPWPRPPSTDFDALLVVSFGGPEGPDDVVPFLENVTRGRNIPRERLAVVGEHYGLFGGISPINEQCRRLIAALEAHPALDVPIYWGNRNWHPMLPATVARMRDDGITNALAFVTSAYSSYSGCRQYRENIEAARQAVGPDAPAITKLRQFFDHPGFIDPNADNLIAALGTLPADADVAFTAHSLPRSMADSSDYQAQLMAVAGLIVDRVRATTSWSGEWQLVYQSRSGPPQVPWLEPDICDHLETLAERGASGVAVAPIGFISDHMEVVYDLDTEAAARAD